jgi:UTP--glucose-1-phosphate uridylyltransferase
MTLRGVIVAAGYGTRFLPITRTIPKEMLPLVARPCLDFVVEEMRQAGIRDILVITSRRKKSLDDWFDRDPELEAALERVGAHQKRARAEPPDVRVQFVRQRHMGGTGHALRLARDFAGDQPVVVAFPDDLFFGADACAAQLANVYAQTGCSVLATMDMSGQDVSKYGVIEPATSPADLAPGEALPVRRVVEKPAVGTEPSHLISVGRYLYTPDFFDALEARWTAHQQGEFYPMGALEDVAARGRLVAHVVRGRRHDTGSPLGYLKAVVDVALQDDAVSRPFRAWLEDRLQRHE